MSWSRRPARRRGRAAGLLVALVALAGVLGVPAGGPVARGATDPGGGPRVLVFTRTARYSHTSIPHAVSVIRTLGDEHGFAVDDTASPGAFTPSNLARYAAVVWLSTTGDVLDPTQQAAFEDYVRAGGGYAGVHAASHTEHDWPWYGGLVGAWFGGVDEEVQTATLHVEDRVHPSTAVLPATWVRADEWYDFAHNPRGEVHVLATLDEDTYGGGAMGADHPIAWCHGYDGGRSWYTAGGHAASAYDEPLFRAHLLHGIRWVAGLQGGACGAFTTPDPTPGGGPAPVPGDPGGPGEPVAAAPPVGAARFVPLSPARVLDTRIGLGAPPGPLPDGGALDVRVAGQGGVPADAVAVALTLTATDAAGPGYVTAWAGGAARPATSSLNVHAAGQTVANLAVVALGPGGQVSLATQRATHLVADVSGYWSASGATAAGRLVPVQPARLLDTRAGLGAPAGLVPSGGAVVLDVAGRGGVPSTGVAAVAVTVTATGTTGGGYVAAWGSGLRPVVSNLNVGGADETVANLVLVPVGPDGAIRLFTQTGAHLVVDVAGWFTDAAAAASGDGLLVPVAPARLLDTRTEVPVAGLYGAAGLPAGVRRDVAVAGRAGVPATGVAAVLTNVTATGTLAPGFVTVHPAATERPTTSNLNVAAAGQTVANLAVARLGHAGRVSVLSQEPLDLLLDVTGWFTGAPAAPTPGVPTDPA